MEFEELTFVEAARIFKAEISERSVALHDLHYDQISVALNTFKSEMNISNLGDKATVKLGPNEQRAIAFIEKQRNSEFTTSIEEELIDAAKLAIRRGKFQKLHREIIELIKDAKKKGLKLSEVFNVLISILKSYPLLESMAEDLEAQPTKKAKGKNELPQIIISESFTV